MSKSHQVVLERPEVRVRIRRRLAIQHARWLLSQSERPCGLEACRRYSRQWRRGWIWFEKKCAIISTALAYIIVGVAILAAVGFLLLAIGVVVYVPSLILLAPPDKVQLADPTDQVAIAMLRMTLLPSALILLNWLRCPGVDRPIHPRSASQSQKERRSFIRVTRKRHQPGSVSRWMILGATCMAAFALCPGIVQLPWGWFALPLLIASLFSIGWLVWRVSRRLMRYRAKSRGPLTIWEYLSFPAVVLALFAMLTWFSPVEPAWSRNLIWFGPIGFLWSQIFAVGMGQWLHAVPVLAIITTLALVGWFVARDAGTWRNRKRLIASQRRPLVSLADVPQVQRQLSAADLRNRIRRDLGSMVFDRRYRSWRFWLTPIWLRRRSAWYITVGVTILLFQLVLIPVNSVISSVAEPVKVIGAAPPVAPDAVVSGLLAISVAIVVLTLEVMCLYDQLNAVPTNLAERPRAAIDCWYETQGEGVLRMPMQLVLLAPFLFIGSLVGAELNVGWDELLVVIAFLFLLRSLFATLLVSNAYGAVMPWWARLPVSGVLLISAYGMLFMPMGLSVVLLGSGIAISTMQIVLAFVNVAAILMFLFVCYFSYPPRDRSFQ